MNRFKFLAVVFTALLIFMTSCQKENKLDNLSQQESEIESNYHLSGYCQKSYHQIDSYEDGAHLIENFIYVEKDYDEVNQLDTKESFFEHYMSINENNNSAKEMFKLHGQKYGELGFDGYLNYITNEGLISPALSNYYANFRHDFTNFINSTHPSYNEYHEYLENKGVELHSNLNLCDYDKYIAKVYHVSLLGVGKYIYDNHYGARIIGLRDCEGFWQNLVCGTGGVIAGTTVGVLLGVWEWGKSIITGTRKGVEVSTFEALYQVYKISVDMWKIGVSFYEWCCRTLYGGNSLAKCGDPTGAWFQENGCNDYNVNIVGPGLYTITNWNNGNTDPAVAITPTPRLNVSIPDVNSVSILQGTVLCTDDNGNSIRPFFFTRQIGNVSPLPTPFWNISPPSTANINQSYMVEVGNPPRNGDLYTMTLSRSWGYSFNLITGGLLRFTGIVTGQHWVEVTFTHICTGETEKTGLWVTVN